MSCLQLSACRELTVCAESDGCPQIIRINVPRAGVPDLRRRRRCGRRFVVIVIVIVVIIKIAVIVIVFVTPTTTAIVMVAISVLVKTVVYFELMSFRAIFFMVLVMIAEIGDFS